MVRFIKRINLMRDESLPLFLSSCLVEIMLICCIPKQVIINFKGILSCGTCLGSPHRIKNMNLSEVMVLLSCLLEEGDPHSFWDLVSIRDKAIKQPEFLLEVTEKLSGVTFLTLCEVKVCDVGSQGDSCMLCNI